MYDGDRQDLRNLQLEAQIIGTFYKNPDLLVEYERYVRSEYDFSDEAVVFFFDNACLMYKTYSQNFAKASVIAFMSDDDSRLATFKRYGGWKSIETYKMLAVEPDDLRKLFDELKKFSLLREYDSQGFDVTKLRNSKKFASLTPNQICRLFRAKADKVNTIIMGDVDVERLNNGCVSLLESCCERPDMGFEIPFPILNMSFRGVHLKNTMGLASMSNMGKSRFMIKLVAYLTLVQGVKTLVLLNEMSVEKMRKALLTTVLNNPEYIKLHGVNIIKPEREIVLGKYRDDFGRFIRRDMNSEGNYTESLESYMKRLELESEEFRKVMKVAQWIDDATRETILVKDICADYSDQTLDFEIRKAVMTRGCKAWFYDTCKNSKTGEWADFKNTVTMLTDISKQLNVFGYVSMQLNDDTNAYMPDEMNSSCIAEAKQTKHVLDSLVMIKRIERRFYDKYGYEGSELVEWSDSKEEVPMLTDLDPEKDYYCFVVDKNRDGDKPRLLFEVDLDLNTWKEIGYIQRKPEKKETKRQ